MKKTIYKLFGFSVLTILRYEEQAEVPSEKPEGEVVELTEAEMERYNELKKKL